MHLEPLAPRRLFAAGPDLSFADAGTYEFPSTFVPGYQQAGTPYVRTVEGGDNGSVFVAGSSGNAHYVAKLDKNGHLITKFGTNGYAKIPNEATVLAYDAANGLLYVGSNDHDAQYDASYRIDVSRLRPAGKLDRAFGTNGVFDYSLAKPAKDSSVRTSDYLPFASARVERINPLPDGSVVLAVERVTAAQTGDADQSLALIKLRPTGTRDTKYGNRGVTQVTDGVLSHAFLTNGGDADHPGRGSRFTDVRTSVRGVTSVTFEAVDGYTDFDNSEMFIPNLLPTKGRFLIWSEAVSAKGDIDASQTSTWKTADTNYGKDGDTFFDTVYAAPGDGGVTYAVQKQYDGKTQTTTQYLYTLKPGAPARKEKFAPKGLTSVQSMERSAGGTFYASDGPHVVRLRADFKVDSAFADGLGVATSAIDAFDLTTGHPFIDAAGRVYAFDRRYGDGDPIRDLFFELKRFA